MKVRSPESRDSSADASRRPMHKIRPLNRAERWKGNIRDWRCGSDKLVVPRAPRGRGQGAPRWRAPAGLFRHCLRARFAYDLKPGFLIDNLHRQADLAALIEAHQLDKHLVAFLDDVGGFRDALRRELRNMHQPVPGTEEIDEGSEFGGLDDRALIDLS